MPFGDIFINYSTLKFIVQGVTCRKNVKIFFPILILTAILVLLIFQIFCLLLGKGPLKEHYRERILSMTFSHVHFCLPWLEPEDYPVLLGKIE